MPLRLPRTPEPAEGQGLISAGGRPGEQAPGTGLRDAHGSLAQPSHGPLGVLLLSPLFRWDGSHRSYLEGQDLSRLCAQS